MMKFKKFLAAAMTGAMMLGLAATAAPAVSAYAAGEEETAQSAYTVAVDYDAFTATIKAAAQNDAYVILEVLKDETGEKVSATYTYPVAALDEGYGVVVDLSFLKASKEAYIRVHGSSESAVSAVVKISAQPKKFSMKYTSGQGSLVGALLIDKAAPVEADLAAYEYRTLYGSDFAPLADLDQATVEIAGTTIIVRKAAVTSGDNAAVASPEVKVKIAAAPKAPKVTVDYVNGKIKLAKGTEYQVVSGATQYAWVATGDKAVSVSPLAVLEAGVTGDTAEATRASLAENGFSIAVRTAATEKKAASNVTIVEVPAAREITDDTKGTVTVAEGTLTYAFDETGTTITATGASFLYSVDGGTKWSTLKAGAKKVIKATTAEIMVKAAGDKTAEVWASSDSVTIKYVAPTTGDETTPTPTPTTTP